MEWIFDGIGTALITLMIGLFTGATVGYKIGVNKSSIKQNQRAGNNSTQTQIAKDINGK